MKEALKAKDKSRYSLSAIFESRLAYRTTNGVVNFQAQCSQKYFDRNYITRERVKRYQDQ